MSASDPAASHNGGCPNREEAVGRSGLGGLAFLGSGELPPLHGVQDGNPAGRRAAPRGTSGGPTSRPESTWRTPRLGRSPGFVSMIPHKPSGTETGQNGPERARLADFRCPPDDRPVDLA